MIVILFEIVRGYWALFWPRRAFLKTFPLFNARFNASGPYKRSVKENSDRSGNQSECSFSARTSSANYKGLEFALKYKKIDRSF